MTVQLNDTVRKLFDDPNPAVLATVNPDGSPQTSVVWVGRDGDELVVSSQAGRRKERNVRRDPRVSISVFDRYDPQQYAEVRGVATVSEDVGRELAVRLDEAYDGPGAGDEVLNLPPEAIRVVIRITPTRVTGYSAE
jgi:PPOX class probable F420-dependent enzyme